MTGIVPSGDEGQKLTGREQQAGMGGGKMQNWEGKWEGVCTAGLLGAE